MSSVTNPYLHNISVTAIIHNKRKYLITKRSPNKKAFPNKWTVPGGKLETSDYINLPKTTPAAWYGTVTNTLKREVKEEVGLTISNIRYLIDMTIIGSDNTPTIVLSFFAKRQSGTIKLDEDSVDFAWVTARQAKNYDLIEGIYEEIVMVDKILKGAKPNKVKFRPR